MELQISPPENKSVNRPPRCHRCGGLIVCETIYGIGEKCTSWRCLLCGDVIDVVILVHRGLIEEKEEPKERFDFGRMNAQHKKREWNPMVTFQCWVCEEVFTLRGPHNQHVCPDCGPGYESWQQKWAKQKKEAEKEKENAHIFG